MVGWLTSRTCGKYCWPPLMEKITVADVMVRAPISVSPDTGVEEAAACQGTQDRRHAGPGGRPAGGVVTMLDVIGAFLTMLSLIRSSSRLTCSWRTNQRPYRRPANSLNRPAARSTTSPWGQSREETGYYFRLEKSELGPIVEA